MRHAILIIGLLAAMMCSAAAQGTDVFQGSLLPDHQLRDAPLSYRRIWKPWGGALNALNPDLTVSFAAELDSSYRYVRLWFGNDTDAAWQLDAAVIAPSAAWNNGYDPIDADGHAVRWRQVTFGSEAADGDPPSQSGQATSASIPPSPRPPVQAFVASAWINLNALPRMDGGRRPLLFWRTYVRGMSMGWTGSSQWNSLSWRNAPAPQVRGFWAGGDALTATGNAARFAGPWLQTPVFAVEYLSRTLGVTAMICGDSIEMGQSTLTNQANFLARGSWWLWSRGLRISAVNMAYGGKPSATFAPICRSAVRAFHPTMLMYPLWTPNDPWSGGRSQAQQQNAAALLAECVAPGCMAVAVTPAPQDRMTAQYYAVRDAVRTMFLDHAGAQKYLDLFTVYGDPAAGYDRFREGMTSDGLHPNDAGAEAAAAFAADRIKAWLELP